MAQSDTLGENIQKARKAAHMTQRDLATAINKSFSLINKYESNVTQPPIDVVMKIAQVLGTDYASLIGSVETNDIVNDDLRLVKSFHIAPENIQVAIRTLLIPYVQ